MATAGKARAQTVPSKAHVCSLTKRRIEGALLCQPHLSPCNVHSRVKERRWQNKHTSSQLRSSQMIAPEIEVMAEELGDSVILSKMDCTTDNDNKKWAMGECVYEEHCTQRHAPECGRLCLCRRHEGRSQCSFPFLCRLPAHVMFRTSGRCCLACVQMCIAVGATCSARVRVWCTHQYLYEQDWLCACSKCRAVTAAWGLP